MQGFRGTLVDFAQGTHGRAGNARCVEDGILVVDEGRIVEAGAAEEVLERYPADFPVTSHAGRILMPGFIDAHVHYAQTDVIASHGAGLLDWLERHTFPAEARFAERSHAAAAAEFFLDELLRNGTTTAAVYPSVHFESTDAFFEAAAGRGLRMIAGKVMMDRNCPPALRDEAGQSYEESARLIERWHGRDRLAYAVTPRFAATSSEAQLAFAGRLLDEYAGLYLQTHIAENEDEIRWVAELYPWSRSYLEVYDRFGLVRERALYAHCIHLDDADFERLAAAGAAAVHCPMSNLFLGSGLFDLGRARAAGVAVCLATDVGGGTSFSMLRTMHEAYKVAQMAKAEFTAADAFYLATRGGAQALGLEHRIGSFDAGREADFNVLRLDATPLMARRMACAASLEEKLFVLMMLGDDRAIESTYVMAEPALVAPILQ
jgi:guanine deaminase